MNLWGETLDYLRKYADKTDRIAVGYSGGKDSLCVLDLCSRVFKKIYCFNMEWCGGFECDRKQMEYAKQRYGIEIIHYPHFSFVNALKGGIFCNDTDYTDRIPDWTLRDVYDCVRGDLKVPYIAHGAKTADGLWRRKMFNATKTWTDIIYPIKTWTKQAVMAYMRMQKIPIPAMSQGQTTGGTGRVKNATGIDLSDPSIWWLHDNHPEDYKKLLRWFPYAHAAVCRRDWYGAQAYNDSLDGE